MKRITQSGGTILAAAVMLLMLCACSVALTEQDDAGTVTISIGSNARATAAAALEWLGEIELEALLHTIWVVDEDGVEQWRVDELAYGERRSFSLAPGLYTFHARAFYNNELKAIGNTGRNIHSGANPAIVIQMGPLPNLEGEVAIEIDGVAVTESVPTGTELTAVYAGPEQGVISFQWHKGQEDIPGEIESTYTPIDEGEYSVTVNCEGYKGKSSQTVTVVAGGTLSGSVSIRLYGELVTEPVLTDRCSPPFMRGRNKTLVSSGTGIRRLFPARRGQCTRR